MKSQQKAPVFFCQNLIYDIHVVNIIKMAYFLVFWILATSFQYFRFIFLVFNFLFFQKKSFTFIFLGPGGGLNGDNDRLFSATIDSFCTSKNAVSGRSSFEPGSKYSGGVYCADLRFSASCLNRFGSVICIKVGRYDNELPSAPLIASVMSKLRNNSRKWRICTRASRIV